MSSNLVEFMLARIADDDRTAELHEQLFAEGPGRLPETVLEILMRPERLRAEATTKRALIALHSPFSFEFPLPDGRAQTLTQCSACEDDWPCHTLQLAAGPYADHPDYREEWRP